MKKNIFDNLKPQNLDFIIETMSKDILAPNKYDPVADIWSWEGVDLYSETLKISSLIFKYRTILSTENLYLYKLQSDLKKMSREARHFATIGENDYSQKFNWEDPVKGRLFAKADIEDYITNLPEIIELNLSIAYQNEKIDYVTTFINELNKRGFNIKTAMEDRSFKNGIK